jgi:hypothetical protein
MRLAKHETSTRKENLTEVDGGIRPTKNTGAAAKEYAPLAATGHGHSWSTAAPCATLPDYT